MIIVRKLFSRHTPKGLKKYKDYKDEDLDKMTKGQKLRALEEEDETAVKNSSVAAAYIPPSYPLTIAVFVVIAYTFSNFVIMGDISTVLKNKLLPVPPSVTLKIQFFTVTVLPL